MFETCNAFIHIDIKTAQRNNPSDYKGRVPIGLNQSSYLTQNIKGNLPFYYHSGTKNQKYCLTYVIQIIYEDQDNYLNILAILLICIPNARLYKLYGEKILGAEKNKKESFQYIYANESDFKLLEREKRIQLIYCIDQSMLER